MALAKQLGYLDAPRYERLIEQVTAIRKMINGYIAFLKQSKRGALEPGANQYVREEPTLYVPTAQTSDGETPDS